MASSWASRHPHGIVTPGASAVLEAPVPGHASSSPASGVYGGGGAGARSATPHRERHTFKSRVRCCSTINGYNTFSVSCTFANGV